MKARIKRWEKEGDDNVFYHISIKLGKDTYAEWLHQFPSLLGMTKEKLEEKILQYNGRLASFKMTDINGKIPDFEFKNAIFAFEKRKDAKKFVDEIINPILLMGTLQE